MYELDEESTFSSVLVVSISDADTGVHLQELFPLEDST
jgi:hypothetical protein